MTYTVDQLAAVREAIAQGATRVRYGDREVQYRSLEELRAIESAMAASLAGLPPAVRRRTTRIVPLRPHEVT